jgi:predicted ATPase/class 3 adenylate cyclase
MSLPGRPQGDMTTLQAAMATLESQRALLGDAVVDAAVAGLLVQLQALQAAAQADEAAPAQTLRLVSILFLDVVGSTAMGERLDPEEVHAVMDGALVRFTAIVQAHGGRAMQYAGDSMLAGFGTDEVREDDAERAVRCGLALLAEAARVGREVQATFDHSGFGVRVGVHTGGVLLGGGVEATGAIRGSAVNIAARMEQSAPPGGLLISVDTYRLVQGRFDVQEAQSLQVKGIAMPMLTYLVGREKPRSAQAVRRGLEGVTAALFGRDAELAQMHAAMRAVLSRRAQQGVTLIAEAGLGKTRLVAEFASSLAQPHAGATLLHASAHPQGLNLPYGVIRDLLFRRCDVHDSDPLLLAQAKLAEGLAALFGDRAEEQTALLGQLIGLDYRASPFIAGILEDGKQLRARAFHAWVEYLRMLCATLPPTTGLVLMLDDLHWADDGSLDAVEQLASAGRDLPLLLLCAARPELLERRPDWAASWPEHQRLELQPLDDDDRQALAQSLLQPLALHPAAPLLHRLLVERTDGNPFYMEALLQMLVDRGLLVTSTMPWQLAAVDLQQLQVPTTLVGVLQARLDALLAPQRRALQQASVVGAVFWDDALAALDARAPSALQALCQRALALPREGSAFGDTQEFAFRHHLLHEVTYGTVLKREKREQHHRAALWLEARSAGRGAEFASLIAEHFERAGVPDRASLHWALAANEALARHADSAALAHADRALAQGINLAPEQRFALLRVRAHVWSRRGDVNEHETAIAALESLADAQDDDVLRLVAAQQRVHRLCLNGDNERALLLGTQRLAAAETLAPLEAAKMHNTLIVALGRQGRHGEARVHAQAALAIARSSGDVYTEACVLNNICVGHLGENRLAQAVASGEQALAAYQSIGSQYGAAIAMLNLALAAHRRGHVAAAHAQLLQLLPLCAAIGQQQIGAQGRCNLAVILNETGHAQAALDHAIEGIRMAERIGDRYVQPFGHGAAMEACSLLGQWPQALEHGRWAQAGLAANGESAEALACEAMIAFALHEIGAHAEALAALQTLLATVAARGGWQAEEAEAALACTRLLTRLQDPRAATTLAAAYQGFMAQAAAFEDAAERDLFLQGTPSRREVLAAWKSRPSAPG